MKTNANGLMPTALGNHHLTRKTTMAHAMLVTREDAAVYGFTSHDRPALISGVTYSAKPGLRPSEIAIAAGFAVGTMEIETLNDGTVFTQADVLGDTWSNADFLIFRYNWANIANGIEPIIAGVFGDVSLHQTLVKVELRDLRQYYQQQIGALTSKTCRYRLGVNNGITSRCPVRLDPPAWAPTTVYAVRPTAEAGLGSVVKHASAPTRHFKCTTAGTSGGSAPAWNTTVGGTTTDNTVIWTTIYALTVEGTVTASPAPTQQVFRDSARGEPADWFGEGTFRWLTGANAGKRAKVKTHTADGTFTLALPMFSSVQVGDTYRVTAGCRKIHQTSCRDKLDAVRDFGGEPHAPGVDAILKAPEGGV